MIFGVFEFFYPRCCLSPTKEKTLVPLRTKRAFLLFLHPFTHRQLT